MRLIAVRLVMALALSACATKPPIVRTEIKTVTVTVRANCPDAGTYQAIKAGRPVPLRSQPMPATAEERVAKTQAQLGRYEAEGGWADTVTSALDRCQAEGVANSP